MFSQPILRLKKISHELHEPTLHPNCTAESSLQSMPKMCLDLGKLISNTPPKKPWFNPGFPHFGDHTKVVFHMFVGWDYGEETLYCMFETTHKEKTNSPYYCISLYTNII